MNSATPIIDPGSLNFRLFDLLADATNYLLLLWLLMILIIGTRRRAVTWKSWLALALSIAFVYVLKTLDGKFDLWERIGSDYSTHTALAAALTMSLVFLDRPRRLVAVAVFVGYEILMRLLGFHSLLDILSTLLVVLPVIWLYHYWSTRRPAAARVGES